MRLIERPSPNYNDRRAPVSMLVLHYTGMETGTAAESRLADPAAEVSAHYLVREDGTVLRMVAEDKRAWHAGLAIWRGMDDVNSRSIGIEIVNGGHDFPAPDGTLAPYSKVQIAAVISLCRAILARHDIDPRNIVGHSDVAPTRKQDPGEHFPWKKLAGAGIGLWPQAAGQTGGDLARLLTEIGYDTTDLRAATAAFQRRFRPAAVTGDRDAETLALAQAVRDLYIAG